jgi:hypothetical protein
LAGSTFAVSKSKVTNRVGECFLGMAAFSASPGETGTGFSHRCGGSGPVQAGAKPRRERSTPRRAMTCSKLGGVVARGLRPDTGTSVRIPALRTPGPAAAMVAPRTQLATSGRPRAGRLNKWRQLLPSPPDAPVHGLKATWISVRPQSPRTQSTSRSAESPAAVRASLRADRVARSRAAGAAAS